MGVMLVAVLKNAISINVDLGVSLQLQICQLILDTYVNFQGEIVLDPGTRSTAHLLWIRKYSPV